ncbi:MAG: ABC transporter ATP-binding protein [Verrucomicrobia bacterium]|nr:ABC transporter ATP-binding protein [Verrucomicrobiota bacterium]
MLVEVDQLSIAFGPAKPVVADISWSIEAGRSLAVVGESGSGKSVTALALTRLLPEPPTRYPAGAIRVGGRNVLEMSGEELRRLRGGTIAYVFQEPATALNPVFTVRTQLGEALRLHRPDVPAEAREEETLNWLKRVRLTEPEKRLGAYPHELSGGMQQRVMIAMALCGRPQLLVADEPTTALDVTVEADIMALLRDLKQELGMSVLLITHKFSIIRGLADEVVVMFRGEIVERGPAEAVLDHPSHPYTRALIDCIPRLGAHRRRLATIGDALAEAD